MGTIKESKIVPIGKAVSLLNRTISNPIPTRYEYTSEAEAVTFSFFATTIGANYWFKIQGNNGPSVENYTELYTSPTFTAQPEPFLVTLPVTGNFVIEIHCTGALTLEATGIGVSLGARDAIQTVYIAQSEDDLIYRNKHIAELKCITSLLTKMNNHLRMITEINEDQGDDY